MKNIYTLESLVEDELGVTEDSVETVFARSKDEAVKNIEAVYSDRSYSVNRINSIKKEKNVGLAVMRMQPIHNGHYNLISKMLREMDTVIIGLGSIQESGTVNNPFTPKQRREMIEKVFGPTGKHSKIKIVELRDLGAVSKIAWAMHVFGKIDGMNLPEPTHYYAGSKHDASWFDAINDEFDDRSIGINIVDRIRDSISMSGTEIRKAVMDESDDWNEFVPPVVIDYIEKEFPDELKLSNNIDKKVETELRKKFS